MEGDDIGVLLFYLLPFVIHFWLVRTVLGSWLIGFLLLLVTGSFVSGAYGENPVAGAYFASIVPVVTLSIALVGALVDRIVYNRDRPPARGR